VPQIKTRTIKRRVEATLRLSMAMPPKKELRDPLRSTPPPTRRATTSTAIPSSISYLNVP
jgi:hypothetical protein